MENQKIIIWLHAFFTPLTGASVQNQTFDALLIYPNS